MKKSTRLNILFAIIILLAAGVLWLCFGHPAAGAGLVAVLTYGDDSTQLRIPLDTDHRYDIDTEFSAKIDRQYGFPDYSVRDNQL